jgi:hypothetical protein
VDVSGATFDLYLWQNREPLEQRLQSVVSAPVWTSPEGPYVAGQSEQARRRFNLPLDFGRRLLLAGYTYNHELPFAGQAMSAGETLRISTYWQVLDSSSAPLAVFVHVLDDANSILASWDGLHVSTENWESGDVFIQMHDLHIPGDVSPGVYRIEVGVYSPVTLERLSIYSGPGDETAPQDRLVLFPIQLGS